MSVDVRWRFLAFSAAVVASTIAFLMTIIAQSAAGNVNVVAAGWKFSPLPIAFGGFTTGMSRRARVGGESEGRSHPKEMETISKRTTVSLNQEIRRVPRRVYMAMTCLNAQNFCAGVGPRILTGTVRPEGWHCKFSVSATAKQQARFSNSG